MQKLIILGNGPSLNLVDIKQVMKFPTIGTNRILRKSLKGWEIVPDKLVLVDYNTLDQELSRIVEKRPALVVYESLYDQFLKRHKMLLKKLVPGVPLEVIRLTEKGTPQMVLDDVPFIMNHRNTGLYALEYTYRKFAGKGLVGLLGMEFFYPKGQPSHFFGDGKKCGTSPFFDVPISWLRSVKEQLSGDFQVVTLSPLTGPLNSVLNFMSLDDFTAAG